MRISGVVIFEFDVLVYFKYYIEITFSFLCSSTNCLRLTKKNLKTMGCNVSKKEANVHDVSIGNRYNKTILVKYDVQEKFVTLEEFEIKGGVTGAGFGAEGGGRQKKHYDWKKIDIAFTPIKPGNFLYRKSADKDVYLSIITENEEVIVNTWYVSKKASFVVTEDMKLMEADDKDPLKVHKDYKKIYQEPRASKSSEDKERDR